MSSAVTVAGSRRFSLTGKQLLSILGIAPLGLFVVAHLWTNLYAVAGADAYDAALKASRGNPAILLLEILGLGVPLGVHIWVGAIAVLRWRPNNLRYLTFRNLKFLLQRLSAIGLLGFLGAHVIKARILPHLDGRPETYDGMRLALSEPLTFTVYCLGIAGIAFHLANGVWSASITLGLTTTERGQQRMEWVSAFIFVVIATMGGLALYGFVG